MTDKTNTTPELRRPGPYGPASELIPKNQIVETVEYSDNLFDVLLRICQGGYSQTPVKQDGKIIGMIDMQSLKLILQRNEIEAQLRKYQCGDFINENICYLKPDEWVENKSAWLEDGSALVGNPEEIIGLLTSADILRALSDYTEAFILIEEIETTLRPILEKFFPADKRERIFEMRNAIEANKKEVKKQSKNVEDQYKKIEDLTFGEYESLVEDREFESIREKFTFWSWKKFIEETKAARKIRNDLMHFRSRAGLSETERLRLFKEHLNQAYKKLQSKPVDLPVSSK